MDGFIKGFILHAQSKINVVFGLTTQENENHVGE